MTQYNSEMTKESSLCYISNPCHYMNNERKVKLIRLLALVVVVLVAVIIGGKSLNVYGKPHNSIPNNSIESQLAQFLPNHCEFQGRFIQEKRLLNVPVPLQSSGLLYFHCLFGLIWITERPFEEAMIYTNKNAHWRAEPPKDFKRLTNKANQSLADFLLDFLGSDGSSLLTQFNFHLIEGHVDLLQGKLTPKGKWIKKALNAIILQRKAPLALSPLSKKRAGSLGGQAEDLQKLPVLTIAIQDRNEQSTNITITEILVSNYLEANKLDLKESAMEVNNRCINLFETSWQQSLCAYLTSPTQLIRSIHDDWDPL